MAWKQNAKSYLLCKVAYVCSHAWLFLRTIKRVRIPLVKPGLQMRINFEVTLSRYYFHGVGIWVSELAKERFFSNVSVVFLLLFTYLLNYFLRNHQLCSHSGISQHFKESKGSSPGLQEPSTGPCQYDSVHTIPSYLSKIHFNIVHPPSWSS
jgi:hypothetical protein